MSASSVAVAANREILRVRRWFKSQRIEQAAPIFIPRSNRFQLVEISQSHMRIVVNDARSSGSYNCRTIRN